MVLAIETEYDCVVRFVGDGPRYPEGWEVRVDGEPVLTVGRRRDEDGNTVYELTADKFRVRLVAAL